MSVLAKRNSNDVEPVGAASGFGAGLMIAPTLAWLLSVAPIIPGGFLFWVIALGVTGFFLSWF